MKILKNKNYLLVIFSLFCIYGCDNFLQKDPLDFDKPESYYDTAGKLDASLAGVYDAMQGYNYLACYRLGVEADEGYYNRSISAGPQVYNFTSGHADIQACWNYFYEGINRANYLLANIDVNPEIDQDQVKRIRGEALFLRGYYYFMLVQAFGGVPLILEPISNVDDVDVAKASAKEVYDQILKDMTQAEELVLNIRDIGHGGRVSKSAVRGMLARVCLFMAGQPLNDVSKFQDARSWALKVIQDGNANHSLNPTYSQIFINYAQDKYDINESIWEIEYAGNNSDAYQEGGSVGYLNGPTSTNLEIGASYGGVRATAKLYYAYKPGDIRRDWNIANFTIKSTGATTFITKTTPSYLYTRDCGKFRREYEILLPKNKTKGPMNFPLLRFSDVLLMFAEADNEVNGGPTQAAIDAVNLVRQRAWSTGIKRINIINGGTGYTSAPQLVISGGDGVTSLNPVITVSGGKITGVSFAMDRVYGVSNGSGFTSEPAVSFSGGGGSGAIATADIYKKIEANLTVTETSSMENFRQVIKDERLRELPFETLRMADLIRWGIFVSAMHEVGDHIAANVPTAWYGLRYKNVEDKNVLWPIPLKELTLNNQLKQNPNW